MGTKELLRFVRRMDETMNIKILLTMPTPAEHGWGQALVC
jgi:hypothetical protein